MNEWNVCPFFSVFFGKRKSNVHNQLERRPTKLNKTTPTATTTSTKMSKFRRQKQIVTSNDNIHKRQLQTQRQRRVIKIEEPFNASENNSQHCP